MCTPSKQVQGQYLLLLLHHLVEGTPRVPSQQGLLVLLLQRFVVVGCGVSVIMMS